MDNKIFVKKLAEFTGHQNPIYCLIAAPEPGRFFSAGGDKMIVEWNVDNPSVGVPIAKLPFTIYSLCICGHYLFAGTSEGAIHIIDLKTKQETKYLQFTNEGVFDIQYSKEHEWVTASTAKGKLIFIDPKELKIIHIMQVSTEKIRSVSFNPIRPYLYAACSDTKVYVIDLITRTIVYEFEAHAWSCNVVRYDAKYDHLITASKDAHIRVWDIKQEFEMIKNIPAHNYAIYQIAFNPFLNIYLSASRDKTIKLWNSDLEILIRLDKEKHLGHNNSVNTIMWLNHHTFISAGDDRQIIQWEIRLND